MWLRVPDVQGSYTIPYLQSSDRLEIAFDPPPGRWRAELVADGRALPGDGGRFTGLPPGEYELRVETARGVTRYGPIGVGAVLAALGDSLTEGYHGHGFRVAEFDLTADHFPPEAVSRDRRNFPQFAPTTAWHKPEVNCFQSWMTDLNDRLAAAWRRPVLIANEGWGGSSVGQYLAMVRTDAGWRRRTTLLRPRLWLIHLGVNDERAGLPAEVVAGHLEELVGELIIGFGAAPERVFLCRPSYDYAPGAEAILRGYVAAIDALVERLGLRRGPDFHAAFATERGRWYGDDPVHPGPEGMALMARLWYESLTDAYPEGCP